MWNTARAFHYRECPWHCTEDLEGDKTMEKYSQRLRQRIDVVEDVVGNYYS